MAHHLVDKDSMDIATTETRLFTNGLMVYLSAFKKSNHATYKQNIQQKGLLDPYFFPWYM